MRKPKNTSPARHSFLISQDDILSDIEKKEGSTLLLGKYTLREATILLRKKGFIRDARKRGLWPIEVVVDSSEFPPLQRLQFFLREPRPETMIVDLKIREGRFTPRTRLPFDFSFSNYSFLVLEWLTMQNPIMDFTGEKTPLPGQEHPGLNLGRKVIELFIHLGRLNHNAGILAFPAYFHNALLFSRNFNFVNPVKTAEVEAIRKTLSNIPFKQLAWIVHLNCLRGADGSVYEWRAEEQVLPLHKEINRYFSSPDYRDEVDRSRKGMRFSVDWTCYWDRIKRKSGPR